MAAAVALAVAGASTAAVAGAFALREQSATGQGVSFAGMAAGGGDSISGMFWNPAVVNQVEVFQGEQHVTGILPTSKVDVGGPFFDAFGDGGNIGKNAVVASGYNAYRINDKVAIGLSITTPFGLATDPHSDWGGQLYARSSRVRSINATPTIGYKVNDWFSIAAGVQVEYFDIRLKQATGLAPTAATSTLKADDVGVGFTAGFTVAPWEGGSVGVGYRSAITHNVSGDLYTPGPDFKVKGKVPLPETVSVGVRQRVTQDLTLLGGVEWTNWSRLDKVKVKNKSGGGTITSLPFNYDDGWFFSGGVEYAFRPDLTLRTGVGYELSPVNDKNRTNRLPDDDRWWLSAGGSYKYSDRLSFDLGYTYVFVPGKSKIQINPGDPDAFPGQSIGYNADAKSHVHLVSASVRYTFGGPAPAALVTKD
ncbi:OmpP1/FadL family transporter [Hansschlegelia plantiphila]|uniref:Fatty acid transporter n=1 Tax=Hansschlegelia plantiphila TaxID=374655 RepID=A0A9W6J2F9_9HYPH|nr:OmpP1/FadL family transporter [Hansschlegelia plantiphila]GLK68045.1 fatty acid transporter [Hansschlegelia plantiphila]